MEWDFLFLLQLFHFEKSTLILLCFHQKNQSLDLSQEKEIFQNFTHGFKIIFLTLKLEGTIELKPQKVRSNISK